MSARLKMVALVRTVSSFRFGSGMSLWHSRPLHQRLGLSPELRKQPARVIGDLREYAALFELDERKKTTPACSLGEAMSLAKLLGQEGTKWRRAVLREA